MVDKPGHRKKANRPWGKVAAVGIAVLIAVAGGYYIYENYVYSAPPIYARIDTSGGSFLVELYPGCAPQTVGNFVNLANSGFYDNLTWHRIVPGFLIQTGDPHSRGGLNDTRVLWGAGFSNSTGLTALWSGREAVLSAANHTVPLEVGRCPNLGTYQGYLAMAREGNFTAGLNTGGTQFFVNLSNSSSNIEISGHYTVFGKVISGWSAVQAIAKSPLCQSPTCPSNWPSSEPLPPVFIDDVVILGPSPTTSSTG